MKAIFIAFDQAYYERIIDSQNEVSISPGLTLAEEVALRLNCTPTATSPCLYTQNANNYLTYADKLWRIVGTYLIGGEKVVKLILDDHISGKATYSPGVAQKIGQFYNNLSDTSLVFSEVLESINTIL